MKLSLALLLLLLPTAAGAASLEEARAAYEAGDLDGARSQLEQVAAAGDSGEAAGAMMLLGQIAVDRGEWQAALDSWRGLAESHPGTEEAADARSRLPMLEALIACGCGGGIEPAATTTPVAATAPEAAAEPAGAPSAPPPAAAEEPSSPPPATVPVPPAPTAGVNTGRLLVGGWGEPYDASQEATGMLVDFLAGEGVAVTRASTEIPAVRGEEFVLSTLLAEARDSGAAGALFVVTRFGYREFVRVEAYDAQGRLLWKERAAGGWAIKDRVDRGRVNEVLVERMMKQLGERVGTPDLPTE